MTTVSILPPPQPSYGVIPYLWTATQLIAGGAGYVLYYKEIIYWKKQAAATSTTLSAWSTSPYKEWAFTSVWIWAWATIGLLNLVFELLGQQKLFTLFTYASTIAPLGTIGGALWAYFSYKSSALVTSTSYQFKMLDFYLTIGVSALILIIDFATMFELHKANTDVAKEFAAHTGTTSNENTTTTTNSSVISCSNYVDNNGNWCDSSVSASWGFRLL